MPKSIRALIILSVALLPVAGFAGCGSGQQTDQGTGPQQTAAAQPGATASTDASDDAGHPLRATVDEYATRMMADIKAAEDRGDVIDGVPVGQSSNPYDYVGVSPVFVKLVGLGEPALPAIADEILASKDNGLREYLLAAAGAQISGDTPASGAQSWNSGKEWARQYREAQ